jgi:hypothetical protein
MGSAAKPGRHRVFEKLLKEMNRGPDSYDANYEMLRRELKDSEKATIRKLRTAKDIDEATKFFMVSFERPGIPHYEGRVSGPKWRSPPMNRRRRRSPKTHRSSPRKPKPAQTCPTLSSLNYTMLLA